MLDLEPTAHSDVKDALRLATWGVKRNVDVRFIEAMPVSSGGIDAGAHEAASRVEAYRRVVLNPEDAGTEGVARVCRVPGSTARVGFITPSHPRFCAGCDKLRLSSQGRLRTCLFAKGGTDLRGLLLSGDVQGLQRAVADAMARKD